MSNRRVRASLLAFFAATLVAHHAGAAEPGDAVASPPPPGTAAWVLVIGETHPDTPGTATLRYSDDDAANFAELFRPIAKRVDLLTVLDAESQAAHPGLAAKTRVPTRAELLATLTRDFAEIDAARAAGAHTAFYFVFAGHGGVDGNREGYLVLHDGRFTRTDLYREVLARSHADTTHVILDACRAYFMVAGRGDGTAKAIRELLDAESLERYPTVGVLVATTESAEVHEWSRFDAGVFSHEVRSALRGGADVDDDGRVTYAEVAAFVAAANARVADPRGKLAVYAVPPQANRDVALVDWRGAPDTAFLRVAPESDEGFHVDDERGVRLADVFAARGAHFSLALPAGRPLSVRGHGWEAEFEGNAGTSARLATLVRHDPTIASRGTLSDAFERGLFRVPFGSAFYQGFVESGRFGTPPPMPPPSPAHGVRIAAWSGAGGSVVLAGSAMFEYLDAQRAARRYHDAFGSGADVARLGREARAHLAASQILTAGALLSAAGSGILFWHDHRHRASLAVAPRGDGAEATFAVRFGGGRPPAGRAPSGGRAP